MASDVGYLDANYIPIQVYNDQYEMSCKGYCKQGRGECDCDQLYDHDWKVTLFLALFFVVMFIAGLLMEYFHA